MGPCLRHPLKHGVGHMGLALGLARDMGWHRDWRWGHGHGYDWWVHDTARPSLPFSVRLAPSKSMAWRCFSWRVCTAWRSRFVLRRLRLPANSGGHGVALEGAKQRSWAFYRQQGRRSPKWTVGGDNGAEVGVKRVQLRVDNCKGRSRFRWLVHMSVSVLGRCCCCVSGYGADSDASRGDDISDDEKDIESYVSNDELSVIWLNGGGNHNMGDEVSTFGSTSDHVISPADDFIATAVQCTNGKAITLDAVESDVAASAEYLSSFKCGSSEEIIFVNLGGPGEPIDAVLLGGLSLAGYERIVFSVCSAPPAVDDVF